MAWTNMPVYKFVATFVATRLIKRILALRICFENTQINCSSLDLLYSAKKNPRFYKILAIFFQMTASIFRSNLFSFKNHKFEISTFKL